MIIYLHGFSSAAASNKAGIFKRALSERPFLILDYPAHQPHAAVSLITRAITLAKAEHPHEALILMGSSLGGFYARFLAAALAVVDRVVMINPALEPQLTLVPYIGQNINMVTGEPFEFSRQDFEGLGDYTGDPGSRLTPTLVLLDAGDEVIDHRVAARIYESVGRVVVYPGGSHRFEHIDEAIAEIRSFTAALQGLENNLLSHNAQDISSGSRRR